MPINMRVWRTKNKFHFQVKKKSLIKIYTNYEFTEAKYEIYNISKNRRFPRREIISLYNFSENN